MNKRDKRRAGSLERDLTTLYNRVHEVFGPDIFDDRNGKPFKRVLKLIDKMMCTAWRLGSGRDSELLLEKSKRWIKQAETRLVKRRAKYGIKDGTNVQMVKRSAKSV